MKRGLSITFLDSGEFRLSEGAVEGLGATVQNAMINMLTSLEKDPLWSDRGTRLPDIAGISIPGDDRSTSHVANFAAANTLLFSRKHDRADSADQLEEIILTPVSRDFQTLTLSAYFRSQGGETFPTEQPLTVPI